MRKIFCQLSRCFTKFLLHIAFIFTFSHYVFIIVIFLLVHIYICVLLVHIYICDYGWRGIAVVKCLPKTKKAGANLHLAPVAHISITLLKPVEQGTNTQQKQQTLQVHRQCLCNMRLSSNYLNLNQFIYKHS